MNRIPVSIPVLLLIVMLVLPAIGCQGGSGHDSSSQQKGETAQVASGGQDQPVGGPAPKIEFAETSYDFGTVHQQSSLSHTFKVKNAGDAPLTLIRAKAG